MDIRKDLLVSGQYYHVYSRSIAKFIIFNDEQDYNRFIDLIDLYRFADFSYKYSDYLELTEKNKTQYLSHLKNSSKFVEVVSYCIMPTHIHLVLKQTSDSGISKYMAKVLNSYTRYFNCRHHRQGPLMDGKFRNVLIRDDEQMLHLTRYFHLNPTSAGLVKKPEKWLFSSYHEYINGVDNPFCDFDQIIDIDPKQYQIFVEDRIDYQKKISLIKHLLIDDYSG